MRDPHADGMWHGEDPGTLQHRFVDVEPTNERLIATIIEHLGSLGRPLRRHGGSTDAYVANTR